MTEAASRREHWEHVFATRAPHEVSWYQATPETSLALIRAAEPVPGATVVDVGGGASAVVDGLLAMGLAPTVLDISAGALEAAKARLGGRAADVEWVVADITDWQPPRTYAVWHDRAAFHFLIDEADRRKYRAVLERAVDAGGHAIIATFAPDGPETCSGLPVRRHSAADIAALLGPDFELLADEREQHLTPWGKPQMFQWTLFRRRTHAEDEA